MKNTYNIVHFFAGILFTISFIGCGQPINNNINKYLSKEEIKSDFTQLTKIIETNVPFPFYSCPKTVYDSLKKSIRSNIPDSANMKEVYRIFYPLVQTLNDAHFSLHLPDNYFSDRIMYFPLKVIIQGNKIFVKTNLSTNDSIQNGNEIVSINTLSVKEIVTAIRTCNFKSASEELFFEKWNEPVFHKRLAALFNINSPFDIELATGQHFKINGIAESLLKEDTKDKKEPSFKILEEKTGYLKIPTLAWNKQEDRKDFDKQIDSAFFYFQSYKIRNLIIDIRGNRGGSSILAEDVLDYIHLDPYSLGKGEAYIENGVIKETMDTSLHTTLLHPNSFKGKTILLNDALTYSSGHMMQVGFQYYKMGETIGEMSSEPLFITGEVNNITLKNSRLQFYYGTANFILPGFKKDEKTYYTPNMVHIPTLTERLQEEDIILKKVKDYIIKRQ